MPGGAKAQSALIAEHELILLPSFYDSERAGLSMQRDCGMGRQVPVLGACAGIGQPG